MLQAPVHVKCMCQYMRYGENRMMEMKFNIDAMVEAVVKPQVRKDTSACMSPIPADIRRQGFDEAAGIDMDAEKPASKPLVFLWDKEQNAGIYMTVDELTRRRLAASLNNDEAKAQE